MCFWLLSYILFDKNLFAAVRAETELAIHDGVVDSHYLLDKCPLLEAVYYETLRMVNGALSARKVVSDTHIGGKILRPGNTVVIPYRQLHYNEHVFGRNAKDFDPERFLKDKSLSSNSSYRPFGGGVSYCPGRYLAKQEVYGFVALLLHRFDIQLATTPLGEKGVGTQIFPRLDETKPSLGVTGPVAGMDVYINVKRAGT
ncbi:hypothetical protein MMC08_006726 [Hypocenomyce scalaris]|nr:hypothetical protein [Hypocenomyce scalaris]